MSGLARMAPLWPWPWGSTTPSSREGAASDGAARRGRVRHRPPSAGVRRARRHGCLRSAPAAVRLPAARPGAPPRWRRLVGRFSQPWVLSAVAAVAVVLGLAAIFGSGELLGGSGESKQGPKPGGIVPGDVEVAVLNGTSVPGLAAKVGDDVRVNGFKLGTVTNSRDQFDQTVVMYAPGQQRAAQKVAHD